MKYRYCKPICDWGMYNLCLIPTIFYGRSETGLWLYLFWLRGRLGLGFYTARWWAK